MQAGVCCGDNPLALWVFGRLAAFIQIRDRYPGPRSASKPYLELQGTNGQPSFSFQRSAALLDQMRKRGVHDVHGDGGLASRASLRRSRAFRGHSGNLMPGEATAPGFYMLK
jgi:hypothetical protein